MGKKKENLREKFSKNQIELRKVFGGRRNSEPSYSECAGTGCSIITSQSESGIIIRDWEDIECGDDMYMGDVICAPVA